MTELSSGASSAARFDFQVMPSGEVQMVPMEPTATNCFPAQVTKLIRKGSPMLLGVQVTPSGEVWMVLYPTATIWLGEAAMEKKLPAFTFLLSVHWLPSGEARMNLPILLWATAKYRDPVQTSEAMLALTPAFLWVQVIPSGEVSRVPFSPVAKSCFPAQAIFHMPLGDPVFLSVHTAPSGEVRMVLLPQAATYWVPVQAIE